MPVPPYNPPHPARHKVSLTPAAKTKVFTAIQRSLAPSTRRSYQSAIRNFHSFCDRKGIPVHARTPIPEPILCAFAADGLDVLSGSTTRNRIAALKAWHTSNDWPWYGSARLSRVIRGVHNTASTLKRRVRPPVSIRALSILAKNLDHHNPLDAAVFACACTAFWGQCRLGELLPTKQALDPTSLPLRRAVRHSPGDSDTWILRLPATKTNRQGQDVALVRQRGTINPLRALHNHLQLNKNPIHLPLFTFKTGNTYQTLTKRAFLNRCNRIWSLCGQPTVTGHSFRIGGTTHYLLAGVPPDVVKVTGRWSTDSFLRYWRTVECIAPIHTKNTTIHKPRNIAMSSRTRHRG
jgi:hypothetical protein